MHNIDCLDMKVDLYCVDRTEEWNRLERLKDMKALEKTPWVEYIGMFEEIVEKMVRCPWGCSEFLHRCNVIPFDVLAKRFMTCTIAVYSNEAKNYEFPGIRGDLLDGTAEMLMNPSWKCRLAMRWDGNHHGPLICSCRYHDKMDQFDYIHVPRHPSGPLAFRADNDSALVRIVPRTIQPFKANRCTDSYRIVKLIGHFAGLDTCSLTMSRDFHRVIENVVSHRKDLISMHCRNDYGKLRFEELKRKYGESSWEIGKAKSFMTTESRNMMRAKFGFGASYMPLKSVVEMQSLLKDRESRSIRIESKTELISGHVDVSSTIKTFISNWPERLVTIQPVGCVHGRMFSLFHAHKRAFAKPKEDAIYYLMLSIGWIAELWGVVNDHLVSNAEWEGWILNYISLYLLPRTLRSQHRAFDPFMGTKPEKVKQKLYSDMGLAFDLSVGDCFREWFRNYENEVFVADDSTKLFGANGLSSVKVLFVIPKSTCNISLSHLEFLSESSFELRLVVYGESKSGSKRKNEAVVYCRHGSPFTGFWGSNRKGSFMNKSKFPNESEGFKTSSAFLLAVFVNKVDPSFDKIQRQMLALQHGQSIVQCQKHAYYLVEAPTFHFHEKCMLDTCSRKPFLICPFQQCCVCVCKKHFHAVCPSIRNMSTNFQDIEDRGCIHMPQSVADESALMSLSMCFDYEREKDAFGVNAEENDDSDESSYDSIVSEDENIANKESMEADIFDIDSDEEESKDEDHLHQSEIANQDLGGDGLMDPSMLMLEADDERNALDNMDNDDDSKDHVNDGMLLPRTDSHRRPFEFDVSRLYEQGESIPNHILLNVNGNLLIRRHKKLLGSKASRHFLQRLVATSERFGSVPLMYPEGVLFPTIFWMDMIDSSVVGSIPVCCLSDKQTLNEFGLASLFEHYRTRSLDPTIPTFTDVNYLGFAWDCAGNIGMRGSTMDIINRRGFADFVKDNDSIRPSWDGEAMFDTQQIDTRKVVNQIAAANAREGGNSFFFTYTCNQTDTPGVRKIREWIDSDEALHCYKRMFTDNEFFCDEMSMSKQWDGEDDAQIRLAMAEGASGLFLRVWNEYIDLFLPYLKHGKDSPFRNVAGGIENVIDRSEIQGESDGKHPHHHTQLFMKRKKLSNKEKRRLLAVIRGCRQTFIVDNERKDLCERGLLPKDFGDQLDFLEEAVEKLSHHCTKRCQVLKRDENGKITQERQCRVPDNRKMSEFASESTFSDVHIEHSQQTLDCLLQLGMILPTLVDGSTNVLTGEVCKPFMSILQGQRHIPACLQADSIFSPANPVLYSMLRSSMNLQYTTSYLVARYLAKYIGQIDKSQRLIFRPKFAARTDLPIERQANVMDVQMDESLLNTKITRNRIGGDEAKQAREKQISSGLEIEGRAISVSEMLGQFYAYPQIRTSFKYINIPTQAMGHRPTIGKTADVVNLARKGYIPGNVSNVDDLDPGFSFPCFIARFNLKWKAPTMQFDDFQCTTYLDALFQPSSMDKITLFSLRPPELSFVDNPALYFIWFDRSSLEGVRGKNVLIQTQVIQQELMKKYPQWIDGTGCCVRVRELAVAKICERIQNGYFSASSLSSAAKQLFFALNGKLMSHNRKRTRTRKTMELIQCLRSIYMKEKDLDRNQLPVYWFRTVRASEQVEQFMYHILLSMGRFRSELELMNQGSLPAAFQKAGLFIGNTQSDGTMISRDDKMASAKQLVQRYIQEQLQYYPNGTATFDKELACAYRVITDMLVDNVIRSDSMPAALYTQLRFEATSEVSEYCNNAQEKVLQSIYYHLKPFYGDRIPEINAVRRATFADPVEFDISTVGPSNNSQSESSWKEHQKAYEAVVNAVTHYKQARNERTKSILLVGAGGVGKTVDMRLAGLYCMCQGLYTTTTTLTGKRGAEIAGEHVHVLFGVPVNPKLNAAEMAEKAFIGLCSYNEKRLSLLHQLDVLLIDEFGQIDTNLLSALDLLLRRIRKSTHWFGGVLVMATIDVQQMQPIRGLSPMLSPVMLSTFSFHRFQIPLRTHDQFLQEIQMISRMGKQDLLRHENAFCQLIIRFCQFVPNEDSPELPHDDPGTIYCFSKHEPCIRAEKRVLTRLKRRNPTAAVRTACDFEERKSMMGARTAREPTIEFLNRKARQSQELVFAPWTPFVITFNDTRNQKFFHGELCMLFDDIPSQEDIDAFVPIVVYRAPPGVDRIPDRSQSLADLLAKGWTPIRIGKQPNRKYSIRNHNIVAYREQYGLRHHVASTIHSLMGSTVSKLVTRINMGDIWEAAQVIVLLSRVRHARDLFFIGDPDNVARCLFNALLKEAPYQTYINKLLDGLVSKQSMITNYRSSFVSENAPLYVPMLTLLPGDNKLVCYMLLSMADKKTTYVGQTNNLHRRFYREHNRLRGSSSTKMVDLQPWAVFGFVLGFQSREYVLSFEHDWKKLIKNERHSLSGGIIEPMAKLALAQQLIEQDKHNQELKLVQCGKLKEPREC
ncbi:MAG: GIY-YIG nuclease family protein [Marinobacter sp.]